MKQFLRNNVVSLLLNYNECLLGILVYHIYFFFWAVKGHFIDLPGVSQFGPQLIRTTQLKKELKASEASFAMSKNFTGSFYPPALYLSK